jgi:riboflavin kinase/FMN adenylyltransferase
MFDGVHTGHQRLLLSLKEKARQIGTSAALITFSNHPRLVLRNGNEQNINLLQTNEERLQKISECGIDYVFTIEFSQEFSSLSPTQFLDLLITKLHPHTLILGYDNYFGRNRAAELDDIITKGKYRDMFIERTDDCVYFNGLEVSSTQIRQALATGKIYLANAMLGYEYLFSGEVIGGMKNGRQLGFPTANLNVNPLKQMPLNGVYAVKIRLANKLMEGVLFIGQRQTFGLQDLSIEVHIFNFNSDIYKQTLEVALVDFIRPQRHFSTPEALTTQIKQDCDEAKRIFSSLH